MNLGVCLMACTTIGTTTANTKHPYMTSLGSKTLKVKSTAAVRFRIYDFLLVPNIATWPN